MSTERPSIVARRLGLPTTTRLFGDRKQKLIQFARDDHERETLKEAEDSFCFPIMEEELGQENTEDILDHAKDLSMKSFLACRVAQRRCLEDQCRSRISVQASNSTLKKEIKVGKELQEQKSVLARSIAAEQKKVEQLEADKSAMAKQTDELKTELNNLWTLCSSAESEKK